MLLYNRLQVTFLARARICGKVIANSKLPVLSFASLVKWAREDSSFLEHSSIVPYSPILALGLCWPGCRARLITIFLSPCFVNQCPCSVKYPQTESMRKHLEISRNRACLGLAFAKRSARRSLGKPI